MKTCQALVKSTNEICGRKLQPGMKFCGLHRRNN